MPGNVQVKVDVSDLVRELDKLGKRVDNVPMSLIGEGLITAIDDRIQSQGNGEWPDFSPITLKLHPRRSGATPLSGPTRILSNMQVAEGPDWVKVKSPADYAHFHVTGAFQFNIFNSMAPHELPRRDFLDIDLPRVLEEAAELVATYITK